MKLRNGNSSMKYNKHPTSRPIISRKSPTQSLTRTITNTSRRKRVSSITSQIMPRNSPNKPPLFYHNASVIPGTQKRLLSTAYDLTPPSTLTPACNIQSKFNPYSQCTGFLFDKPIRSVLLVKKWNSKSTIKHSNNIAQHLKSRGIQVFIEPTCANDYDHAHPTIFDLLAQVSSQFSQNISSCFPALQNTVLATAPTLSSTSQHLGVGSAAYRERLDLVTNTAFWAEYSRSVNHSNVLSQLDPRECIAFSRRFEEWQQYIDLVVAVGGDGTLLHVSTLFAHECPPVVGFSSGSFGFLMPFNPDKYTTVLNKLIDGKLQGQLRNRLMFTVESASASSSSPSSTSSSSSTVPSSSSSTVSSSSSLSSERNIKNDAQDSMMPSTPFQQRVSQSSSSASRTHVVSTVYRDPTKLPVLEQRSPQSFHLLNEVVLKHSYGLNVGAGVSDIECHINNQLLARFQGDGLILASPTGSTAYSLSVGGSIIHPAMSALLLSPIAPMTLSSRPLIVPADSIISLSPVNNPVLLEGKFGRVIHPGETLHVTQSIFPIPVLCRQDSTSDFIADLGSRLNYSRMVRFQRDNDDVEQTPSTSSSSSSSSSPTSSSLPPSDSQGILHTSESDALGQFVAKRM